MNMAKWKCMCFTLPFCKNDHWPGNLQTRCIVRPAFETPFPKIPAHVFQLQKFMERTKQGTIWNCIVLLKTFSLNAKHSKIGHLYAGFNLCFDLSRGQNASNPSVYFFSLSEIDWGEFSGISYHFLNKGLFSICPRNINRALCGVQINPEQ